MQKWSIGIDNGSSLVTEEIIGLLLERGFPYESITLYGEDNELGDAVEVGETEYLITPRDNGVSNPPDILFITNEVRQKQEPIKAKLTISANQELTSQHGLIVPEVNSGDIHHWAHEGFINVPTPAATAVITAINPLAEQLGLTRLHVTTMEPMSGWGSAGLEMFSSQVHKLLNGIEPEGHEQLAFNVLPFVGPLMGQNNIGSLAVSELLLNKELTHFYPEANISSIRSNVPIFYGLGAFIEAEFKQEINLIEVEKMLREAPDLMLINESEREPVSLREVVGSDATMVGRLRMDPSNKQRLFFWVALDNLRKGAATSMVEVAEIAIRDHAHCLG